MSSAFVYTPPPRLGALNDSKHAPTTPCPEHKRKRVRPRQARVSAWQTRFCSEVARGRRVRGGAPRVRRGVVAGGDVGGEGRCAVVGGGRVVGEAETKACRGVAGERSLRAHAATSKLHLERLPVTHKVEHNGRPFRPSDHLEDVRDLEVAGADAVDFDQLVIHLDLPRLLRRRAWYNLQNVHCLRAL
eukprot:CAMPEP_0202818164 /NCGR_PEP_ID=MMETSP1389-20130828/8134_1 /ASSEMBLY_ACC=CAM_ASM_000865 /TAXON_ID=302021 /ORGANISM="Rhodomonas sp., Strain CCMP768" /LENGTH=187 /DNA_ID=CAMNT_0049490477 /DNA_START=337 /DNA_END=900 /DNA_ORIENTATION=+